jgi:hypothetical protein
VAGISGMVVEGTTGIRWNGGPQRNKKRDAHETGVAGVDAPKIETVAPQMRGNEAKKIVPVQVELRHVVMDHRRSC